ncbi:MAG TPA: PAS domain-containing protein [Labilithrix sp.]|nr:PAS domain-containing protein [Labilithrix sp.]
MDPRSLLFGIGAAGAPGTGSPADIVRPLLDAVPGGVIYVAADGAIVEANAEALRLLGQHAGDLTGRSITDFATTTFREDGTPFPAADYPVTRALATGEPQEPVTIGMKRPDGVAVWAVFRVVPARDPKGTVIGAIATFLDITERKRAEEELRLSESKWRLLAENLPDFVVIVDREARIQSINRILPEYAEIKVIGTHAYAYFDQNHVDEWKAHFASTLETGTPARFETRGIGDNGAMVWYEEAFVPIVADGRVERVMCVGRDITERRAMVARLAEKERLASVGMLSASVAHEIMNPLTYVLANLDFALSDRCPPGARKTKAIIDAREGAARMQQIVWDLRALGRTSSEELFYVDVRSVFETALRLAGPEVAKNVEVKVDLHEVPGVLASESRLCQVFINLVVNAVQAMNERGFGEREIRVRTQHDEGASLVGVEISDTGNGIEPEHLPRIFDPFFTTKQSGTGLGLSISRESVERMGGRIDVTSERGRGTTFTVWLSTTRRATRERDGLLATKR